MHSLLDNITVEVFNMFRNHLIQNLVKLFFFSTFLSMQTCMGLGKSTVHKLPHISVQKKCKSII